MMIQNPLKIFNWSTFLQTQIFMLPVLLLFYQENGLTIGDFFLFQGIFSITALLFEVPSGYLGDIFPRKNILILSYSFFLCRLLLWMFFGGYWILLIGEILYSLSKATYSGVADGYIYDYLKTKNKTKDMLKYYGRLNFYMSIGTALASVVGPFLYEHYGFMTLLVLETILNTVSILMLFLLPKVPPAKKKVGSISDKYHDLYRIAKSAFKNVQLKYYMFYSGMLAATTMVFVWSFQPLMKAAMIPVSLYGVVYGFNHGFRALAGFCLHKTLAKISLKNLGVVNYVLYILSFLSCLLILKEQSPVLGMVLMIFICFVIGSQLTFTLGSIARIHSLTTSDIRSTVASVNNMISRFMAGVMLILFKFLLDGITLEVSMLIYLGIFVLSIYPLYKIFSLHKNSLAETSCLNLETAAVSNGH